MKNSVIRSGKARSTNGLMVHVFAKMAAAFIKEILVVLPEIEYVVVFLKNALHLRIPPACSYG